MANTPGVLKTILGYQVDQASQAQAIQSLNTVGAANTAAVQRLNAEFASVSPRIQTLRQEQSAFRADLDASIPSIQAETVAIKGLNSEFEALAKSERNRVSKFSVPDIEGGGGGLGKRITTLSSQARIAVPAIPLGNSGISSETLFNSGRLVGALTSVAEKSGLTTTQLLGAGAATVVLGVALVALTNNAKAAKDAALADLDARTRAITLLRQGTQEEVQARITELTEKRKLNEEIARDASNTVDQIRQTNIKQFGGGGALTAEINSVLGTGAGELSAAKENAEKANKALNETSTELDDLSSASGLAAQGLDEIVASANRVHILAADISNNAAADLEAFKVANDPKATTRSLDERIHGLQLELAVTQNSAAAALSRAESLGIETAQGKAAIEEMNKLNDRAAATQAMLEKLSQSFVITAVAANELIAANEKIRQEEIQLTQKYNDDKLKLDQNLAEKQTKLYTDLADGQIELADKVKESTAAALDSLAEKSAALKTKLGTTLDQDKADAEQKSLERQRKFLQNEAIEEKRHQDDLLKIQKDSDDRIFTLGLDRNFAGIAQERRNLANRLAQSNQDFANGKAERLARFAQESADNDAHFIAERDKKIVQFQTQLDDLKAQEKKQESQINANYTKQYNKLTDKFNKEFGQLSSGYAVELTALQAATQQKINIASQGSSALLQIEEDLWKQAQEILKANFNPSAVVSGGGGSGGGPATPTQDIRGFGNARSSAFPTSSPFVGAGAGGGSSSSSANLSQVNNFYGADPKKLMPLIEKRTRDLMADTLQRMNRR